MPEKDPKSIVESLAAKAAERNSDQLELFIANHAGVMPKDDHQTMEHPFFSVGKKIDMVPRHYSNGDVSVSVTPSGRGLATIWDKDILLYAASQVLASLNQSQPVSRRIRIDTFAFLKTTKRSTSVASYERIEDALLRLRGTTISTTIVTGGKRTTNGFGLIEEYSIVDEGGKRDGSPSKKRRVLSFDIVLSEWFYRALLSKQVLTITPEYYEITGGTERRLYEIAKKKCGYQDEFKIGLEKLFKRSGQKHSTLPPSPSEVELSSYKVALKKFRYELKKLVKADSLPEYTVQYRDDKDMVYFYPRTPLA